MEEKIMKKLIALLLIAVLALSAAACSSQPADTQAPAEGTEAAAPADGAKVVKIGVFEPASGDNGAGGKQETLGVQYANKVQPTVEIGGETYNVELVIVDNESSNDKAPTAAANLVAQNVSIVLGSYGSGVSIAAGDVFNKAGIPAMGITCTNPNVTAGNSYYFRICFLDPFQGTVHANFAKEQLKADTIYCLGELGNDYDQGLINYCKEAAEKLGIKVITESFPKDNSDFTSYLNNAKKAGAQAIFAPCSIQYAQLIVEQSAAQGIDIPLLGSDTWDNNTIVGATKGKDVQVYVSTFYQEGANPDFEKGIKEWINGDAKNLENNGGNDMLAAVTVMGYDAYMVAIEALKAAGSTDAAAVMAALPNVTYTGISGSIAFNEIGDAIRDSAVIKKSNSETGEWEFVAVQKAEA